MNRTARNTLTATLGVGLLLAGVLSAVAAASMPANPQQAPAAGSRAYLHSYNLNATGLALEGYCPVAYFVAGKPLMGKAEHASTYKNVDYRFFSARAKRMFDANPEKYVPAYGGWCAYGMAVQDKFPVDPTNFKIVDGRLMVFLRNPAIDALSKWDDGNERAQVIRADAHWRTVSR